MKTALSGGVLAILLYAASWSPPSWAQQGPAAPAQRVKLLLLPLRGPEAMLQQLRRALPTITEELQRLQIFSIIDGNSDQKLATRISAAWKKDCLRDVVCTRQLAETASAEVLLELSAEPSVGGNTFTFTTFDGKTGRQIRQTSDFASDQPDDRQRALRWLTRMVASPVLTTVGREKGVLKIDCSVAGATAYINGKRFELTAHRSFRLAPGAFDVVVQAPEHRPFHDVVVVHPGQEKLLSVQLTPLPGTRAARQAELARQRAQKSKPVVAKPITEPKRFYQTWWFWTIVGVAVAGAGATTAYFLLAGGPGGEGQVAATWR